MTTVTFRNLLPLLLAALLGAGAAAAQTPAAATPAGSPLQLSAPARSRLHEQMAVLARDTAARTPAQRKIASALRYAAKEKQAAGAAALAGAPMLRSNVVPELDGRVRVKIKADVSGQLLAAIRSLGGDVQSSFPSYRAVYATLPLPALETLAARADVESITPPPVASNNVRPAPVSIPSAAASSSQPNAATGVNDPEGDLAHGADKVRAQYGATGGGISVGVLSDSVDDAGGSYQNAVLNGYVPAVNIIPGQAGTGEGEGLAMLEVVHRLAPGATLYFATGASGAEQMADNIKALAAAGCRIIIDDEFYSDEDPFQDGVIAQAVDAVSAQGVLYFTCSANYGNQDSGTSSCWEGDFKGSTGDPTILDFAAGTANSPQELNGVNSDNQAVNVVLFWSEPLGGATSAYSLYEIDAYGDIIQVADTVGHDPTETLNNFSPGDYAAVEKTSGSARFLHLDIASQFSSLQFSTAGRTRGHDACGAANAFCVAATPAAAGQLAGSPSGPYPSLFSSGNQVETFSNDGPRRVFFNPDGSAITPGNFSSTGGQLLGKPDFTAADGVSTSLPSGQGLNPFFGTSCAAPHAGAIAALLLSYNPAFTPAQAGAALRGGAVQITNPGPGDRDSGAGILLAPNVIQTVNTPPSIITFSPANGPAGTIVTVTGINLKTAVSAAVNGVPAVFSVVSGNAVTVTVPAGATTGPVTILTAGGTATSATNFTLTASVSTPVISSASAATGKMGDAFSYQTTATNAPTSFAATGLPAGLVVNPATGLISGIPTVSGVFAVTLSAGNVAGGSSSATLTLTILPAAPVVTSAGTAGGQLGTPFGFQIVATNLPTSFAASGLPAGLMLNPATGLISGTPSGSGTFTATVSATNAGGTGSGTLTLTILPAPPVLSGAAVAGGQVGVAFGFQLAATNAPTGFAATGLPGGLTLNAASGLIAGTPTTPGTFVVTLAAANAGGTGSGTLTLTILPATPVITGAATASAPQTVPFTYAITATGAPTAYTATGLPAGLSLNAATGVISGVPTAPVGTYPVTLAAANAGGTGTATLTLTVAPPPYPTVTLTVPAPSVALNSGAVAEFLLTLSSVQTQDLVVAYVVKGSGVNGTDYVFLKGTVKIKAGKLSKLIKVTPLGDLGGASKKTVKLTLAAGNGYLLDPTVAGKVKILAAP